MYMNEEWQTRYKNWEANIELNEKRLNPGVAPGKELTADQILSQILFQFDAECIPHYSGVFCLFFSCAKLMRREYPWHCAQGIEGHMGFWGSNLSWPHGSKFPIHCTIYLSSSATVIFNVLFYHTCSVSGYVKWIHTYSVKGHARRTVSWEQHL